MIILAVVKLQIFHFILNRLYAGDTVYNSIESNASLIGLEPVPSCGIRRYYKIGSSAAIDAP